MKRARGKEEGRSLEELGYYFVGDDERLVSLVSDESFEFISAEHYDAVGAAVVRHIQKEMKSPKYGALQEIWFPVYNSEEEMELARLTRPSAREGDGQPPLCRYGFHCFRTHSGHRKQFFHPPSECLPWLQQVRCNVFVSPPEVMTKADCLLVFICGMGPVRAGQWARKLCMFESLQAGSILPYLARAKEEGYAVIVLNPNYNEVVVKRSTTTAASKPAAETKAKETRPTTARSRKRQRRSDAGDDDHGDGDGDEGEQSHDEVEMEEEGIENYDEKVAIPFNENGFRHVAHVWDRLITPTRFGIKGGGRVGIVAHSFGGNHALSIMQDRSRDIFSPRSRKRPSSISAVAFIDSVHSVDDKTPPQVTRLLRTRARHWVRSRQPLDAPLDRHDSDEREEVEEEEEEEAKKKKKKKKRKKTNARKNRKEEKEEEEEEEECETKEAEPADGCKRVSAGSDSHDHCPSACLDSVFRWLGQVM